MYVISLADDYGFRDCNLLISRKKGECILCALFSDDAGLTKPNGGCEKCVAAHFQLFSEKKQQNPEITA
jgi:hypothetical protein